jgi:hypothetical protein
MIGLDQVRRMHVLRGNPFVVTLREALPLDQVPERPILPEVLVIDNFFNLLLFFPINQVWWGLGEVGPMVGHLSIGGEERCMKNIVNPPVVWQLQSICHWGDDFLNAKWPIALWIEFTGLVWKLQMGCF